MISAKIIIKEIYYRKSFENLFPMGIQKLQEIDDPSLSIRFLLKMGSTSMTAALGILELMNEESKGELLCSLVNLYCVEIQSALNILLQKDDLGKNITIGDIYMAQENGGRLVFISRDIKVNYNRLAKNDTVKQKIGEFANEAVKKSIIGKVGPLQKAVVDGAGIAVEVAAGLAPKEVEKKVLSVMNKEENKWKLLRMAEEVLAGKGLGLKLEDAVFTQEHSPVLQGVPVQETGKERKFEMSAELEEELLDAVTKYLKMLLKEG